MLIAQMRVVVSDAAGTEVTAGYLHEDGRGFVAWNRDGAWLGKSKKVLSLEKTEQK